jgi:hypothetical protein
MRDNDARLSQIYVAPTGSVVPNNSPNSADKPLATFDLIITGEAGDEIVLNGGKYTLQYTAFDFTAGVIAPAAFNAVLSQNFGAPLWIQLAGPNEDYVTQQPFTIKIPAGSNGHVFQYTASLIAANGDVVSFVESEKFILV